MEEAEPRQRETRADDQLGDTSFAVNGRFFHCREHRVEMQHMCEGEGLCCTNDWRRERRSPIEDEDGHRQRSLDNERPLRARDWE